jgi:hypothetical protein
MRPRYCGVYFSNESFAGAAFTVDFARLLAIIDLVEELADRFSQRAETQMLF